RFDVDGWGPLHQNVAPDGPFAGQVIGKNCGVAVQQVQHPNILRGVYWPKTSRKNFWTGPGSSATALATRGGAAGGRGPSAIRRAERWPPCTSMWRTSVRKPGCVTRSR